MIKNKSVIITGGSGFVGSHLAERLLENGNFVVLINKPDNSNFVEHKFLEDITKEYELKKDFIIIDKDLRETINAKQIDYEIDYIFHMASITGKIYSRDDPTHVLHNDLKSTSNILELALNYNLKRFIFPSSSLVYGNSTIIPTNENCAREPISYYGLQKLYCEEYINFFNRIFEIPTTIFRYFSIYGPRQGTTMAIRRFFDDILIDKEVTIFGDGEQKRDFIYISDIVDATIKGGASSNCLGEVINVGRSKPIALNILIRKMYDIANKKENIKYIEDKIGNVSITQADINKAINLLDFNPEIGLNEGLKKQYEWQKALK